MSSRSPSPRACSAGGAWVGPRSPRLAEGRRKEAEAPIWAPPETSWREVESAGKAAAPCPANPRPMHNEAEAGHPCLPLKGDLFLRNTGAVRETERRKRRGGR